MDYHLDLGIKTIAYTLRIEEEPPRRVRWSLLRSDWMKVSNGSWELRDEGGGTRAVYSVDIQIKKRVLSGSVLPCCVNMSVMFGMTLIISTAMIATPTTIMTTG